MRSSSHKNRLKKEKERYYLDRVKALYNGFPSGEIVPFDESRYPDFIIRNGNNRTGIEMTNYVRGQGKAGSPLLYQEKLREKIIRLARDKFFNAHQIPLTVGFHWQRI